MAALVVSTQPDARRGQFCGGTVIAPTAVLTAAHCVRDDADVVRSPAFFDVVVGRSSLRAAGGQRVHVAGAGAPVERPADRALRRRRPAPRRAGRRAVAAPGDGRGRRDAGDARLAGPGRGLGRDRRRRQRVPRRPAGGGDPAPGGLYCQAGLAGLPYDPASMACAAYDQDDADVCNGDSGGPLARQDAAGAWVQLGIVSWGLEGGCRAPFTPTAYAQVSAIRDWAVGVVGLPAAAPPPAAPVVPPAPADPAPRRRPRRADAGTRRQSSAGGPCPRRRRPARDGRPAALPGDRRRRRTREIVRVWGPGGRLRVRIHTRLAASLAGRVYTVRWRVPPALVRVAACSCIDAYDVQGAHDRSCATCAALTVDAATR